MSVLYADKVVGVSTIKPEWDDVIVITVDYSNMPKHLRQECSQNVYAGAKTLFPHNKIMIVSTKTEVSTLKEIENKESESGCIRKNL